MGRAMPVAGRRWLAMVLALIAWPTLAASPPQHFALPGHGELLLNVPGNWRSGVQQSADQKSPDGVSPTIWLSPQKGAPFVVQINAAWDIAPDRIRSIVAAAAKSAEPQSVEGSLALHDLVGTSGHGYYFVATDKAPAPGEWKYLTQG